MNFNSIQIMANYTETITITFCDQGENHVGNQKVGNLISEGFTYQELETINHYLRNNGIQSELYDLGDYLPQEAHIQAGVVVIRKGVEFFMEDADMLFDELRVLTYDTKAKMYGRVVNKKARHNLIFADFDQEADYENGKGTIINLTKVPYLAHVRKWLPQLVDDEKIQTKLHNLIAEANHYYDITKTYIGFHGDLERKVVVGMRLGATFPLYYQWYQNNEKIGNRIEFSLNNGDIYIMSEKACGFDGRKRLIPTLKHAAGFETNLK